MTGSNLTEMGRWVKGPVMPERRPPRGCAASPCGIERNRSRPHDHPRPRIRQTQMQPGRLGWGRVGIAEGEVDQLGRMAAPALHARLDLHAVLAQRPRELDTLRVFLLDNDAVAVETGQAMRCTSEREHAIRRYDDTLYEPSYAVASERPLTRHCTILRAPTHRATHQAPSVSVDCKRDSFTPAPALWINVWSPTYKPTCVTPPPGWAANSRMSPGRNASITGVTSAPERA